jgi:hypothetical protein
MESSHYTGNRKINNNIIGGKPKFASITGDKSKFVLCELSSVGWTMYYICRGPGFEPGSSHLSTLRVEFRATRLLNKKKKSKNQNS